jgi:hypothetical protein
MNIAFLIKLGIGLVVVLAASLFLFFYLQKEKKKKEITSKCISSSILSLKDLSIKIKNETISTKELKSLLDIVLRDYGIISKNSELHPNSNFKIYQEILLSICNHPHTNKNIIINFDKELSKKNPEYKQDISNSITKGLNIRVI